MLSWRSPVPWRAALAALVVTASSGCALVYPEYGTRIGKAPEMDAYDPPPPEDRLYFEVLGATIPPKTRDGREWDEVLGSLPDPFLKITVNEAEVYRTDPESDTLTPSWKDAPKGNFPFRAGQTVRIEIWDANTLIDHPIGVKQVTLGSEMFDTESEDLKFDGGVELHVRIRAAKPLWGFGLKYEVHSGGASITTVMDQSPASRAGVQAGDKILKLADKDIANLSSDDVISEMNGAPTSGIKLTLQHGDGSTVDATIKQGPIYALFKDAGDPSKVE
ncbi:MAG: PDZ domain-containing protein [Polyangiaceae bacterium]